jgi:methylglutaconyl-CoA hydratase
MFRFGSKRFIAVTNRAFSNYSNIQLMKLENGITHLSLVRENGKNSLSKMMVDELNHAIDDIKGDSSIKVVIVKSSVANVFCAGADLKERLPMSNEEVETFVKRLRDTFQSVATIPVPVIAAIEGAALGGGLELALACDMRIAGAKATLGLPETSLAIIPGAGGTQRLSRVIGIAKAKELIYTCSRLTAEESFNIGLVNKWVEADTAAEAAEVIALKMLRNGPMGMRMAKAAVDGGFGVTLEEGLEVERKCYAQVVNTKDRLEGINAFVEKRKPQYKGN